MITSIQRDMRVDKYIENQPSPQKEICSTLREIITHTLADARETMKWGVPSYDRGRFYMVSLKDHVNLGFTIEGLTSAEADKFEGSGKTMRVLEFRSPDDINRQEVIALLERISA